MATNSAREIYTEGRRFSSDNLGPDFGATKVYTFGSLPYKNWLKILISNTLQQWPHLYSRLLNENMD
jgi:hypothetical protein